MHGLDDVKYLEFLDMPLDDLARKMPQKECEMQRSDELMPSELLASTANLHYPMAQINRVSFNPNFESVGWIFSGNQAGLGRLHFIKSITK